MEFDKEGYLDFKAWYHLNKDHFSPELDEILEVGYDSFYFLFHVYRKVMDKMPPALRNLMAKQYPVFKTESRPLVREFIDIIATTTGYSLLFRLKNLVEDQKKGVSIREKYPRLEEWKNFYIRPQHPGTVDESKRHQYVWLNDKEWKVFVQTENKKLLELFNWKESRKFKFIDIVQNIVLEHFKELEDLNSDEWIIYALVMREEYEYYMTNCDKAEMFIDCGFPEEQIKLKDDEFMQVYSELSDEMKMKLIALRNRRIAGEEI